MLNVLAGDAVSQNDPGLIVIGSTLDSVPDNRPAIDGAISPDNRSGLGCQCQR